VSPNSKRVLEIEEQHIKSPTLLFGNYHSIRFTRCTFERDVTFYDIEVSHEVALIECIFNERAILLFKSGTFNDRITLGFKKLHRLYIQGGNFKDLHLGYWGNMSIVDEITIDRLNDCSGTIELTNTQSEVIHIAGENPTTSIILQDLLVNNLNICYFHTTVPIRMFNIKSVSINSKESEFNIHHSTLAGSVFFGVDFDSFNKFNIRQSFIGETKFINCHLDNGIEANVGRYLGRNAYEQLQSDIKMKIDNVAALKKYDSNDEQIPILESSILELSNKLDETKKQEESDVKMFKKENYKQMKISAQSIGDSVNEKKYHALEMNEYLKLEKDFIDLSILWMSKISSNFGQSLARPIAFHILFIHVVLFGIYFGTENPNSYYYSIEDSSWEVFRDGVSTFCFLISPFRDLSLENHGVLDLFFRINAGFFI
jgi:hypothetical protein